MSVVRLFVITAENTTLLVECSLDITVEDFRIMLATRPGYPVHASQITFNDTTLTPGLTLAQSGVCAWSRLCVIH